MNLAETLQDSVTLMVIAFFAGALLLGAALIKSADRGAKQAMPTFVVGVAAMVTGFYLLSDAQDQTSEILYDTAAAAVSSLLST